MISDNLLKKHIEDNSQEKLIYDAAKKLNVDIFILGTVEKNKPDGGKTKRPVFILEKDGKRAVTMGATTSKTSYTGIKIAVNKIFTNKFLSLEKIPVPFQKEINSEDDLAAMFKNKCEKIILKPYGSRCGKGVMTEISNLAQAKKSYAILKEGYEKIISEEQVEGGDFRVLVVDYKTVAVLNRIPPKVIGNGKDSIKKLIEKENETDLRKEKRVLKPIKIDDQIISYLKKQNLKLESIPADNQEVDLTNIANISAGGKGINVTEKIHPENKKIAERTAKALGLDVAGIDIITKDISRPLEETTGKIIEVNGGPDLRIHYYVSEGDPINPGEFIIKNLLNLN